MKSKKKYAMIFKSVYLALQNEMAGFEATVSKL